MPDKENTTRSSTEPVPVSPLRDGIPDAAFLERYGPAANLLASGRVPRLAQLLEAKETVRGPATSAIGREIIMHLKQIRGWRTPFRWFFKSNMRGSWVIVSYHHPAQLCWEWSVWVSVGRRSEIRSWNPLRWFRSGYGRAVIGIPHLFSIALMRQSYGWMVSGDAENLIRFAAQGMAAGTDATGTGAAEGNSPTPPGDAPNSRQDTGASHAD